MPPIRTRPDQLDRQVGLALDRQVSQVSVNGDILDSGVQSSDLSSTKITAALYGRNGVGKTTFACQGKGPIALIAIDPSPTGGSRSINRQDVVVFRVAARFLEGKDGRYERVKGSEKVLAIVDAIRQRSAQGKVPFSKVVIDGLNSWFEVILSEVLGTEYESMPAILSKGKVSTDQYVERSERLIRYLRPVLDLPCDVWLLAQEKDHNPPRDDRDRVRGSKLMREAHSSAQEGSFYSFAISDEATRWVQNACDFVMQLYEENEFREEKSPDVVFNNQTVPGTVQLVPTGRRVKRLRCQYHTNYAARFRSPDYRSVPDYIEAPTPEDRYQAFLDVIAGRKTKWGSY